MLLCRTNIKHTFFKQGYIPIGNLHYGWIYNYGLGLHTSNSSVFDSLKIVTL